MKKNVKVEREYEIKGDEKILICEYKYDDKGNVIYKKDSNGDEYYYVYDNYGNIIYMKDNYGYESRWVYRYDDKGNIIYEKNKYGDEFYWEYKYDDKGDKSGIDCPDENM